MSYLKLWRGRMIVAAFVASVLLLISFPGIDLAVSGVFFRDGFHIAGRWWQTMLHSAVTCLLCISMIGALGLYVFNRLTKQTLLKIDGRKVCYLLVVLVLGPGLIVNLVFKDNFGRARPRDIQEFGGEKIFTPPFVISNQCDSNCSFSSGEGAAAFFSLALAFVGARRRRFLAAAMGFGVAVSVARIAAGAHFFSDTVVSFFVMLILADVLYHYMFLAGAERAPAARLVPVPAQSVETL